LIRLPEQLEPQQLKGPEDSRLEIRLITAPLNRTTDSV
jgi:hypothetical protein